MDRKLALKYYRIGRSLPQGSYESQFFFDLSIKYDSTFSYAYFEKSVPFNKRGDYANGFDLLNKAVTLNPKMHLGYRGWLRLVKLKDYKGCLYDLNTLTSLTNGEKIKVWGQNIFFIKGICFMGIELYNDAIEMFNEYIIGEKQVDDNVYLYQSIIFYKLGKYTRAEFFLRKHLNLNSKSSEGYYYLGKTYSKKFSIEKAIFNYEKAVEFLKLGYKNNNHYNEHFYEIYFSDIKEALSKIQPV